jgi:hypothetical protein
VIARIETLMQHEVAGDPCTGLKWTQRTTGKIANELKALGIEVSARTVARILGDLQFSLRANRKSLSQGSGADRDEQFSYIAEQRMSFVERDLPIVSVDSKKKEMVGNFKNAGRAWNQTPVLVRDHDFRSDAVGMATPYGIYDVRENLGAVFIGTSHDTPDFAADNLRRWWVAEGRKRYPKAKELLVLADSGGSNGLRNRAFKYTLQNALCDPHRLQVTVCHYPTGASKWNPIEHRLFSEISKNWAGRPLDSYETIVNYIASTSTATGLRVTAHLVEKEYPKGKTITKAQMATLDIRPHQTQPRRNYTIWARP